VAIKAIKWDITALLSIYDTTKRAKVALMEYDLTLFLMEFCEFLRFLAIISVGIREAMTRSVWNRVKPNRKTLTINERTNMKLMQYTRPSLAWPMFGRLNNLQDELEQLFASPQGWAPLLDVHEDKDAYSIRVELPGMRREDIEVSLQNDALVISGERKAETLKEDTEVHRQERSYGKFSRVLTLPSAVAGDQVKAAYKDGILTVTLPKAEAAKPKAIAVSE